MAWEKRLSEKERQRCKKENCKDKKADQKGVQDARLRLRGGFEKKKKWRVTIKGGWKAAPGQPCKRKKNIAGKSS